MTEPPSRHFWNFQHVPPLLPFLHVISVTILKNGGPYDGQRGREGIRGEVSVSISRAHRHRGCWKQASSFCKMPGIQASPWSSHRRMDNFCVLRGLMPVAQEALAQCFATCIEIFINFSLLECHKLIRHFAPFVSEKKIKEVRLKWRRFYCG